MEPRVVPTLAPSAPARCSAGILPDSLVKSDLTISHVRPSVTDENRSPRVDPVSRAFSAG